MDFEVKNIKENVVGVARAIGYVIIDTNGNEYNLVRKIHGNNYPRFHIYLKKNGFDYNFSLHLDQKAPVYEGSHAHAGEYNSPVVMDESDRIKEILKNV